MGQNLEQTYLTYPISADPQGLSRKVLCSRPRKPSLVTRWPGTPRAHGHFAGLLPILDDIIYARSFTLKKILFSENRVDVRDIEISCHSCKKRIDSIVNTYLKTEATSI
jgi:hypothetical protein